MPRDIVAEILEQIIALLAQYGVDDLVRVAVAHEHGRLLVKLGLGRDLGELLAQEEPRRQSDNAGKLVLGRQAREDAHGTALAEAAEYDAVGRDAGVDLLLDEAVEVLLAAKDTNLVLVAAESLGIAIDGVLVEQSVNTALGWP